jgi:uncharacterized protein DUF551
MTDAAKEMLELANKIAASGQKLVTSNHLRYVISPSERDTIVALLRSAASAPSQAGGVREALDNSQSLLAMIYQLNTNGSVSEHDWENEGLADLITKQIAENRAALSALPAPEPWQPIETAPKDGTDILTLSPNGVRVAKYSPFAFHPESWAWYIAMDNSICSGGTYCHPTHWQPLPAAPEPQRGTEG